MEADADASAASLPFRAPGSLGAERVVSVDGAWGAAGLNLSHWPGNCTPAELTHPLATGIALRYARLPKERRAELCQGCVAVSNNHFDTDGLCSVWAVQHPERALELEERLLDAATCGDLYRVRSEAALGLDAITSGLATDPRLEGLAEDEQTSWLYEHCLPHMEELLRGEFRGEFEAPARAAIERFRAQLPRARAALASEDSTARLAVFQLQSGEPLPDRHALFSATELECALSVRESPTGLEAWLVLNTEWFFDYQELPLGPAPDLTRLAEHLQSSEPAREGSLARWRAVAPGGATPQLYFGLDGQQQFDESNAYLVPSRLSADLVTDVVRSALAALRA